jgi:hypothetical protein
MGVVLKLFGPEQCVGHVDQEEERHARAEDHVEHGSDPRTAARIDERAQEQGGAENDEGKVRHGVVSEWSNPESKMGPMPVKPRDDSGRAGIKSA